MAYDGLRLLRDRRGKERVAFDQVADHLADFARQHPESAGVVDEIARFIGEVEGIPHRHAGQQERWAEAERQVDEMSDDSFPASDPPKPVAGDNG